MVATSVEHDLAQHQQPTVEDSAEESSELSSAEEHEHDHAHDHDHDHDHDHGHGAGMADSKMSKGERKARKAILKLGLKHCPEITRVTIRKSKTVRLLACRLLRPT